MAKKMTDDELRVVVDNQVRNAFGYQSGKLSEQRRKALAYYLAKPVGDLSPPDVEGRSRVVATDVADTVESMLPNLLKAFVSSDNVVEFSPQKPEDEQKAKQATEYVNYIFYKQNPGFSIMNTWFKDALIQKNGILKIWWLEEEKETREEYNGLTEAQVTMLLVDEENAKKEIVEQTQYPDQSVVQANQMQAAAIEQQMQQLMQQAQQLPQGTAQAQQAAQQLQQMQAQLQQLQSTPVPSLYDIVLKGKKKEGHVCIENVPPEEFLISRKAKSIYDTPFIAHRMMRSIGELKAMGYKNVDSIQSDEAGVYSSERVERLSIDDDLAWQFGVDEANSDPSMRMVWLTESYIQIDYDGDGIPEWRKVTLAGDRLIDNEECENHPFVSITPVPIPHRFFGTCPAEQAMETQRINTALIRAALDNTYLSVNGRYYAVNDQVNLDDLLTVRPGGVVRVDSPTAVGRLDTGMGDMANVMNMIEFMEVKKENRTGFTRYSQGTSADSLNKTATGINIVTNRADARQDLIARTFAETGVTDLFRRILELVCKYQDKPATVRLTNGWTDIDPREWKNGFDLNINVGLGTGNKDQIVQHLTMLMQIQQQGLQLGLATPQNLYNSAKQLTSNLGFKEPEQFWTDPAKAQPQQPKPDPEQIKQQGAMQLEQLKQQGEMQRAQLQAQQDAQQAERDYQLEMMKLQNQANMQRETLEANIALKREEIALKYQFDNEMNYYRQLYAQSEAMVDDGSRPENNAWQTSSGIDGAPIIGGGVPDNVGQNPQGMEQQPGQGY